MQDLLNKVNQLYGKAQDRKQEQIRKRKELWEKMKQVDPHIEYFVEKFCRKADGKIRTMDEIEITSKVTGEVLSSARIEPV